MEREGSLEYVGIYQAFGQTEHGQTLNDQVRYEKYKPEHVSNEEWRELLGADVNNLKHMHLTYGLTRAFINRMDVLQPGELSESDKTQLKDAAISHDMAESIVTDISWGDKTIKHEEEEMQVFEENLEAFLHGSSDDIKLRIKRAKDEVVFNKSGAETRLSKMFNAIERVGYARTALRGFEHMQNEVSPDCYEAFEWIVADVFGNHIEKLIEYSREYAPVREYLYNQRHNITDAFMSVNESIFHKYEPESRQKEKTEFDSAWLAWHDFINM